MKIGYIRVSKDEQNEHMQNDALKNYGCEKVFFEKVSGASKLRPAFEQLKEALRKDDELVVYDIDRLGRTTVELIMFVDGLNKTGVSFKCLKQPYIDTTTTYGEFIFQIFAVLADHERRYHLITQTEDHWTARERRTEEHWTARERGRVRGRPKGLTAEKIEKAERMKVLHDAGTDIKVISKDYKISRATAYRYINFIKDRDGKKIHDLVSFLMT